MASSVLFNTITNFLQACHSYTKTWSVVAPYFGKVSHSRWVKLLQRYFT